MREPSEMCGEQAEPKGTELPTVRHHSDARGLARGPGSEDLVDVPLVLNRNIKTFRTTPDVRVI